MKINRSIILHLIGIIIFIIILTRINLSETLEILSNVKIHFYIIAVILLIPVFAIKAWRWNLIKKVQHMNYPVKDSILKYFTGLYVGLVTPGRVGEFVKVLYLTRDKHSFGRSLLSVFLDRLFDLAFLIIFSYLSIIVFMNFFLEQFYLISIILAVSLFAVIILFTNKKLLKKILKLIFKIFIPSKYKDKVRNHFYEFYSDTKLFNKKTLFILFIITTISWLIYFVQIYMLALALNINIPLIYLIASINIAGLFTLLPISISGIGTRDITLVFLFSLLGISQEFAVSLSVLMLSMFVFAAIFGLIAWSIKPIKLK